MFLYSTYKILREHRSPQKIMFTSNLTEIQLGTSDLIANWGTSKVIIMRFIRDLISIEGANERSILFSATTHDDQNLLKINPAKTRYDTYKL